MLDQFFLFFFAKSVSIDFNPFNWKIDKNQFLNMIDPKENTFSYVHL